MSQDRTGLRDWIIQRFTAVAMCIYFLLLVWFFATHAHPTFSTWENFMTKPLVRIATLMVLVALLWHSWIGLWTVSTDYLKSMFFRFTFQALVILLLFGYLLWGIAIIWVT